MAGERILIVEDEGLVAEEIRSRLSKMGYVPVGVAHTGGDAVSRSEELHPDLVLMDIRLNGDMDGIEAAEHIQAKLGIPVLYLTAYTDEDTIQRAKLTYPFGYIIKPIEERELHVTIEIALYRHRVDQEREKLIAELRDALANIKTLKGLLPICAGCKNIRNDEGYWQKIEDYIASRSEAEFDEGLCPDCLKKARVDVERLKAEVASGAKSK